MKIKSTEINILARVANDMALLCDEEKLDDAKTKQILLGMRSALRAILVAHKNPSIRPLEVTRKGAVIEWPNTLKEIREAMK